VHRRSNDKGVVVRSELELKKDYQSFIQDELGRTENLVAETNVMLQRFVSDANQSVHSITGFIDRTGELFVARHAAKVLQRMEPVGVGVCFESLPANASLADDVRRLCQELGYFGIFEVEFLWSEGRWNVIDFNPRIFSQIGLDINRGSPLPLFFLSRCCRDTTRYGGGAESPGLRRRSESGFLRSIYFGRTASGKVPHIKNFTNGSCRWHTWKIQNNRGSRAFAQKMHERMPGFYRSCRPQSRCRDCSEFSRYASGQDPLVKFLM